MSRLHTCLAWVPLVAACNAYLPDPRWGGLEPENRTFHFQHNIELFEVVSNGMRVAVVPDDRTNLVTVDVRYLVGAAEDPPGRAGLAHLVEHLLFEVRPAAGGPTLGNRLGELTLYDNAWTRWDATHYTSTALSEHLEEVIAIESQRLRTTCAQLDEATFLRERDVVLSEQAQRSPTTTGLFEVMATVYGTDHPYARPVGSPEIATATRDEACAFIARHYTPDRARMVITGPVEPAAVRAMVGRGFGPIARGDGQPRRLFANPVLDGGTSRHQVALDRPTALVFFPAPAAGDADNIAYLIARARLEGLLDQAVEDNGWMAGADVVTLGDGYSPVMVAAVEVTSSAHLQAAADEVFERARHVFDDVPGPVRSAYLAAVELGYVAAWDDLGRRGSWLADYLQYTDHNLFMLRDMVVAAGFDWTLARAAMAVTLTRDHSHVALLTPARSAGATNVAAAVPTGSHSLEPWRTPVDPGEADRPLTPGSFPPPRVIRYTLDNGLTVELAPDPHSPVVDARLLFPVGRAHQPAGKPTVATLSAYLLQHRYDGRYSPEARPRLIWAFKLGTDLDWSVSETATTFSVRGVADWSDWHLWRLSWLLDQGGYDPDQLAQLRRAVAGVGRGEVDVDAQAFRAALFGPDHPYAIPAPDLRTTLADLSVADLERWKRDHYRARGATLIVSGAFDPATIRPLIERLFGGWSDRPPVELPTIEPIAPVAGPTWLADDDPGAIQATVEVGFAGRSAPIRDQAARLVVDAMLEDELRTVREGLGASYGVHVHHAGGAAGIALLIEGQVDERQAGEAARRVLASVAAVRDGGPHAREQFVRARRKVLAATLARIGGASSIAGELVLLARTGQSLARIEELTAQVAALTPDQVARVAASDLDRARMVVRIAGRPAVVDAAFTAIGETPVRPERPEPPPPPVSTARRPSPGELPPPVDPAEVPRLTLRVGDGESGDRLFQGDHEIGLRDFLRQSGQDHAIRRMSRRRWLKRGLVAGGVLVIGAGVGYALTREDCSGLSGSDRQQCDGRVSDGKRRGLLVAIGGATLSVVGLQLGSARPDQAALRRYANEHNRRLRERAARWSTRLDLAPAVWPGGGGLVVAGQF